MKLYRLFNLDHAPREAVTCRRWVDLAAPIKLGRGYTATLQRITGMDLAPELALEVHTPIRQPLWFYFRPYVATPLPLATGLLVALRAYEEDPHTGKPTRGLLEFREAAFMATHMRPTISPALREDQL